MGYSVEKSTSTAWETLLYALGYNLGMLVVVALSWGVGHRWPLWHRMLAPRNAVGERNAFVKPLNIFATVHKVLRTSEEDLIRVCGTDSAVYNRFFAFCVQLYCVLVLIAFPVLLAVYQQGANPNGVSGINQVSLSNVNNQSTVMWISFSALCFLTLVIFYLCWRHTLHVLHLRHRFFASKARSMEPQNYATIITCIPPPSLTPPSRQESPSASFQDASGSPKDSFRTGDGLSFSDCSKQEDAPCGPPADSDSPVEETAKSVTLPRSASRLSRWRPGRDVRSWRKVLPERLDEVVVRAPAMTLYDIWTSIKELAMLLYVALPISKGVLHLRKGEEPWDTLRQDPANADGASATEPPCPSATTGAPLAEPTSHDKGDSNMHVGAQDEKLCSCGPVESLGVPGISLGSAQPYALPGEPKLPSYISDFFFNLFGEQLLHLQPVYKESVVAGAHKRWRHAIRMLNESRQRWEAAKLKKDKAKAESDKAAGEESMITNPTSEDAWPRHKVNKKWLFFGGELVESIPFWIEQVKEAAEALRQAQALALRDPIRTAVIPIFKTRKAAALCRFSLSHTWHGSWYARVADPAHEMWWDNLRFTEHGNTSRTVWATIMTLVMIVFFYIPVTLIASLASGKALGTTIGAQKTEVQGTWLPPALQSIVPSLALHSVLWIFSPVFMLIGRWEGRISLTDSMLVSSSRFYYVVVINVLIAYSLTASMLTEIASVVAGEVSLKGLMAESLPANAAFYIQYTLNSSLMCGMELGRLPIHICAYLVKVLLIGKVFCDRERHWDQGPMAYHVFIGYQNLIITYGIVYCVIAPLILPFSLLYCLIGYFTWKHELMFIYKDPVDRGGVYWPHLMHHVFNALLLAQITAAGMFSVKQAYSQSLFCIIPFALTVLTYVWFNQKYAPIFKSEPLDILAVEAEPEEENPLLADPARLAHAYFPVWMRPPELPNLDPMAPSDPDIWHYMHPTRHLYIVKDYYPTPLFQRAETEAGGLHEEEQMPQPTDAAEKAFWQLTEAIPRPKRRKARE